MNFASVAAESPEPAPEPALLGEARSDEEASAAPVPSAESETGIPFASPAERVFEEAVAQAPAVHRPAPPPAAPVPRNDEEVLPVTERPANPRRGWWQRLTQS